MNHLSVLKEIIYRYVCVYILVESWNFRKNRTIIDFALLASGSDVWWTSFRMESCKPIWNLASRCKVYVWMQWISQNFPPMGGGSILVRYNLTQIKFQFQFKNRFESEPRLAWKVVNPCGASLRIVNCMRGCIRYNFIQSYFNFKLKIDLGWNFASRGKL